jgi:hypothetical protein
MKVLYLRRMIWYVHERRPTIFDGQPPSRSCRDASTPDHVLSITDGLLKTERNKYILYYEEMKREFKKRHI